MRIAAGFLCGENFMRHTQIRTTFFFPPLERLLRKKSLPSTTLKSASPNQHISNERRLTDCARYSFSTMCVYSMLLSRPDIVNSATSISQNAPCDFARCCLVVNRANSIPALQLCGWKNLFRQCSSVSRST